MLWADHHRCRPPRKPLYEGQLWHCTAPESHRWTARIYPGLGVEIDKLTNQQPGQLYWTVRRRRAKR